MCLLYHWRGKIEGANTLCSPFPWGLKVPSVSFCEVYVREGKIETLDHDKGNIDRLWNKPNLQYGIKCLFLEKMRRNKTVWVRWGTVLSSYVPTTNASYSVRASPTHIDWLYDYQKIDSRRKRILFCNAKFARLSLNLVFDLWWCDLEHTRVGSGQHFFGFRCCELLLSLSYRWSYWAISYNSTRLLPLLFISK